MRPILCIINICFKNFESRAGERTHFVTCLPYKHEDLGLHSQHPPTYLMLGVVTQVCDPSSGEMVEADRFLDLADQPGLLNLWALSSVMGSVSRYKVELNLGR